MQPFFSIKNFKRQKKVMEFLFGIKNFKTVMVFFFFRINNSKGRKKVTESFFKY